MIKLHIMEKRNLPKTLTLITALLVCGVALGACGLPGSQQQLKQAMVQTAVADSLVATRAAGTLTAIIPSATSTPAPTTGSPATLTPTNTPLPNVTPTLAGVWLTLPQDTDCRAGPGWAYQRLVTITGGQLVEVMALDPAEDFYFIRDPNNFSQFCWIPLVYTTVTGNLSLLPVITPMVSPPAIVTVTGTPAALDFIARYERVVSCNGNYGIVLYVENTGSVIFRSIRVILTDNSVNRSYVHDSNIFRDTQTDECFLDLDNAHEDLQYGESSRVACVNSGQFNYNPAGHSFTARITMFHQDDRKGESVTKTITFTP